MQRCEGKNPHAEKPKEVGPEKARKSNSTNRDGKMGGKGGNLTRKREEGKRDETTKQPLPEHTEKYPKKNQKKKKRGWDSSLSEEGGKTGKGKNIGQGAHKNKE